MPDNEKFTVHDTFLENFENLADGLFKGAEIGYTYARFLQIINDIPEPKIKIHFAWYVLGKMDFVRDLLENDNYKSENMTEHKKIKAWLEKAIEASAGKHESDTLPPVPFFEDECETGRLIKAENGTYHVVKSLSELARNAPKGFLNANLIRQYIRDQGGNEYQKSTVSKAVSDNKNKS